MKKKLMSFWKNIKIMVKLPEMNILPGQLAFFFVLSLIPLIALIGVIVSSLSMPIDNLRQFITQSFPGNISSLLLPIISDQSLNVNMIVFFASAFILASNGMHSIIITSNEIYKIKNTSFLKRRVKAIFMTFILIFLLIFVLLVPAFGDIIFGVIKFIFKDTMIVGLIYNIYQIVKYPLSILFIYFTVQLLYTIAPSKKIERRSTNFGALFTTITWLLSTEIYSIYVEVFAKYDVFYGSISNILILLLWVYILSYCFVFGMALNVINNEEIMENIS